MANLDKDWRPEFGLIYTWYAMDKEGKIAMMINNNWGDLPKVILCINDIEDKLDIISDYIWESSNNYNNFPANKNGNVLLDMYGFWINKGASKNDVYKGIMDDYKELGIHSYTNIPINKGFYIYEAVEGYKEGDDYPVGYDGPSKMGDYFRFLQPTIYGSIEDFPKELRGLVAVSKTVDFKVDRLLDNNLINTYFPEVYK